MTHETSPRGNNVCYPFTALGARSGARQDPQQRSKCPDLQSEWGRVVEKQKPKKLRSGRSTLRGGVAISVVSQGGVS